jgi:predicted nucleotidyltransferase
VSSTIQQLAQRRLIHPPGFLAANVAYETLMGSVAYGVAGDASDSDVYGFCLPPKDMIFPHLRGEIPGFGRQANRFEQYQEHHIDDPEARKQYDLSIYSIVKYFQLCMENNPNMVDSLFTPQFCVLHITQVGSLVRESRRMFLHKGSWPKFKGYSYSQLNKMSTKNPEPGSKRAQIREQYGFDCKFGYHVVRLLSEVEQILLEGDLDLQRNREHLKAIRRGDVPEAEIRRWASEKEKQLEQAYADSKLPHGPDEAKIKALLLQCLEAHYGSLEAAVVQEDQAVRALRQIRDIIETNRRLVDG